jgi:23S rRNA pseudouridine1911/1915/1917 synthase
MIRFVAGDEDAGERVDVVLARRAKVTRALAQRALKNGAITVAGEEVRASHRLEVGDEVAGDIPEPVIRAPEAEDIPVVIRYSDDRVLVVSKPPGLVTHPARGHEAGTLVNALLALGEPLAGMGSTRPGIIHRLDKDTSGLLLVAKDDAAQAMLVEALRDRRIERIYRALVRGVPATPTGTIDAPLGRHPVKRRSIAIVPEGRPAVTHYEVVAKTDKLALLEVRLETGRTHQIRVHLAHLGHPVLGDRTYGGVSELSRGLGLARPFLHASRLTFPHPTDGRTIEVTDPLPPDLTAALATAGLALPR